MSGTSRDELASLISSHMATSLERSCDFECYCGAKYDHTATPLMTDAFSQHVADAILRSDWLLDCLASASARAIAKYRSEERAPIISDRGDDE